MSLNFGPIIHGIDKFYLNRYFENINNLNNTNKLQNQNSYTYDISNNNNLNHFIV